MTDDDRALWLKNNSPLEIRLQGVQTPLYMVAKVFSTGSLGWYLSQKAVISDTPVQLSLCVTIIGTKRQTGEQESPNSAARRAAGWETPQGIYDPHEAQEASNGSQKPQRKPKKA